MGERTFAKASGNGEDAPKPAVRLSWVDRVKPDPQPPGSKSRRWTLPSRERRNHWASISGIQVLDTVSATLRFFT